MAKAGTMLAALAVYAAAAGSAQALTAHALLVGVAEQPGIPGPALAGPASDVASLRDYLVGTSPLRFDPANITVLCCGTGGDKPSTHAGILKQLGELAARTGPGDYVYIHFSGYGALQPASRTDEPDGLEEILLPADAGAWSAETGTVANALRKAELRAAIATIRARGAYVLFTIDASFASAEVSAVEGGEVPRGIDPARIGLGGGALAAAAVPARRGLQRRAPALALVEEDARDAVVFAAATGGEPTTEFAQTGKVTGLFTAALIDAFTRMPRATFREINEAIIQGYGASARRRPTPSLEGAADSSLAPALPSSAAGAPGRADQQVDFTLRVALPAVSAGLETAYREALRIVDQVERGSRNGYFVEFVAPGLPADIRLDVLPGADGQPARLWLLPPSGELSREPGFEPPSAPLGPDTADRLRDMLSYVYRSTALSRLAGLDWARIPGFDATYVVVRKDTREAQPTRLGEIPVVNPQDELHIHLSNDTAETLDFNMVYLSADHSLTHMVAERLQPGDTTEMPLLMFTDTTFGRERLATIVTRASAQAPMADFSLLAQGAAPKTASADDLYSVAGLLRAVASGLGNPRLEVSPETALSGSISLRQFDVLP